MVSLPIVSLRMVRERSVPYGSRVVLDAAQAYGLFRDIIGDLDREAVWVACLDNKARVSCISQVSLGTTNASLVHPREVLKIALLANASSVILAHNHPSGDPTPSPEDIVVTAQLQRSTGALGIKFNDHLIIGDGRYYSFADEGKL